VRHPPLLKRRGGPVFLWEVPAEYFFMKSGCSVGFCLWRPGVIPEMRAEGMGMIFLGLLVVVVYDQVGRASRGYFSVGSVAEYCGRPGVLVVRGRSIQF